MGVKPIISPYLSTKDSEILIKYEYVSHLNFANLLNTSEPLPHRPESNPAVSARGQMCIETRFFPELLPGGVEAQDKT